MPERITLHLELSDPSIRVRHIDVRQHGDTVEISLDLETDPGDPPLPHFTAEEVAEIHRRLAPGHLAR